MKNSLFIISGPSGAGEDSIMEKLQERHLIERVITTTTRKMRKGEVDGVSYYFLSKQDFKDKIDEKSFYEWTEQDNGNLYGVTVDEIKKARESDKIVFWKMEHEGVMKIKKIMPDIKVIFINAPTDQIENRIRNRNKETEEFIKRRLDNIKNWSKVKKICDVEITNKDGELDKAVKEVEKIIFQNI